MNKPMFNEICSERPISYGQKIIVRDNLIKGIVKSMNCSEIHVNTCFTENLLSGVLLPQ